VRDGAVLPVGARDDRPDYDYLDGLTLRVFAASGDGTREVLVTSPTTGASAIFTVERHGETATVASADAVDWKVRVGHETASATGGSVEVSLGGVIVSPSGLA